MFLSPATCNTVPRSSRIVPDTQTAGVRNRIVQRAHCAGTRAAGRHRRLDEGDDISEVIQADAAVGRCHPVARVARTRGAAPSRPRAIRSAVAAAPKEVAPSNERTRNRLRVMRLPTTSLIERFTDHPPEGRGQVDCSPPSRSVPQQGGCCLPAHSRQLATNHACAARDRSQITAHGIACERSKPDVLPPGDGPDVD